MDVIYPETLATVFYRKDDEIFHTYSSFGRGLDIMLNAHNFLDPTPKGRDEAGLALAHGVGKAS